MYIGDASSNEEVFTYLNKEKHKGDTKSMLSDYA